jgi:hypothetical protein
MIIQSAAVLEAVKARPGNAGVRRYLAEEILHASHIDRVMYGPKSSGGVSFQIRMTQLL